MAMANPLPSTLKKSYRCSPALQRFYVGGPFAVSSDASFIACACFEEIKIVDAANYAVRATLSGDSVNVTALALSPDDKLLFSASHSQLIRVWDLSTFKCIRSWKAHDGPVVKMACDSSGGLLATGGTDRKVLVWDVDGGYCTHFFHGHGGVVTSLLFHPDPNHLIIFSGSDDETVRVWDLVSKKCIAILKGHFATVTSLAVSENGWNLLSAGRDKVVILWDLRSHKQKMTVLAHESIESVCAIHSGTTLARYAEKIGQASLAIKKSGSPPLFFVTAGERGIIRLWSSESTDCLFEQKTPAAVNATDDENSWQGFRSAVMLPKDQGLLCVTADHQFLSYSPKQDSEGTIHLDLTRRLVGSNEEITDLKFIGEEERFLAVASSIEQVRVFDLLSMTCISVLDAHTDVVLCLDSCVPSSGRALLASGSKDNSVRIWDAEKGCCLGVAKGHLGAVGAVAFSKRKANFVITGSSSLAGKANSSASNKPGTIMVWSLESLSGYSDHTVELQTRSVVAAHDKQINALAVSPNDQFVCSGSQDKTACVWRLPDLISVAVLRGHKRGVWSVEFSPVDQCVLTASSDKTVKIWAIADGTCLKTFEGHTANVYRASFVSRGTQFVSCGADGLVKLWTIKTNECVATYEKHDDQIFGLAIGRKTEMIATGSNDSVVNLWYDNTAAEKEAALLEEEQGVLKDQEIENALLDADYLKAVRLAFERRRPHKLFNLFAEMCSKARAEDQIQNTLRTFGREEVRLLIEYIREWNTKPKLCHVAQFVLFQIFNTLPPTEIAEIKGIRELLEGLVSYSERHFSRMDRHIRSTFLLDYILSQMSVICPDDPTKKEPEDDNSEDVLPIAIIDINDTTIANFEHCELDMIPQSPNKKRKGSSKKRSAKSREDVGGKKLKKLTDVTVPAVVSTA